MIKLLLSAKDPFCQRDKDLSKAPVCSYNNARLLYTNDLSPFRVSASL